MKIFPLHIAMLIACNWLALSPGAPAAMVIMFKRKMEQASLLRKQLIMPSTVGTVRILKAIQSINPCCSFVFDLS